jgi:hypothetical protein
VGSSRSRHQNPPVLLLIYNRADLSRAVANAVREAGPSRVYVAADGPRRDRTDDLQRCAEARRTVLEADWPCEVFTLFRDENLGCRVAVSSAIDWFFEQESEGIILEDDCLPDATFFAFADELLERYRDDERVMAISGNGSHARGMPRPESYVFSRYNHVWGWASWRRAWEHYDAAMEDWPKLRDTPWLDSIGDGHRDFTRYWQNAFDNAYRQAVDSWAYRWTYSCWLQNGLTALPSKNLVKNIGFGDNSTHTRDAASWLASLPLESLSTPLKHPPSVERDVDVDRWIDLNVFGTKPPLPVRLGGRPARIAGHAARRLAARWSSSPEQP